MTETIYSLLMRKYIFGFTTDEEEGVLFDWLESGRRSFQLPHLVLGLSSVYQ